MTDKKNKLFWRLFFAVSIVGLILVFAPVFWGVSLPETLRDLGIGAFTAALIGGLIMWYEDRREERRDIKQNKRDRELAKRIRQDANEENDKRQTADFLLCELRPAADAVLIAGNKTPDSYQTDFKSIGGDAPLTTYRKTLLKLQSELIGKQAMAEAFVRRCGDDDLYQLLSKYANLIGRFCVEASRFPEKDLTEEGAKVIAALGETCHRAEWLLARIELRLESQ